MPYAVQPETKKISCALLLFENGREKGINKKATGRSLLWCPRRELNPYDRCGSQDFKSCVSTSSTTGAVVKKNPVLLVKDGTLSGRPGSNRPPQPWQGCALPNELLPPDWHGCMALTIACHILRTCFGSAKIGICAYLQNFYPGFFICIEEYTKCWKVLPHRACPYTCGRIAGNSRQRDKRLRPIPACKTGIWKW